jgi:hypothetical protein
MADVRAGRSKRPPRYARYISFPWLPLLGTFTIPIPPSSQYHVGLKGGACLVQCARAIPLPAISSTPTLPLPLPLPPAIKASLLRLTLHQNNILAGRHLSRPINCRSPRLPLRRPPMVCRHPGCCNPHSRRFWLLHRFRTRPPTPADSQRYEPCARCSHQA